MNRLARAGPKGDPIDTPINLIIQATTENAVVNLRKDYGHHMKLKNYHYCLPVVFLHKKYTNTVHIR